jgi:hypothetical protein
MNIDINGEQEENIRFTTVGEEEVAAGIHNITLCLLLRWSGGSWSSLLQGGDR